jgi:8-hydroxy-5-deazaflavin:NADPH oxidoreductase
VRIAIIGAGNHGRTLAAHFVRAGHDVVISNSRGPETLLGFVEQLGDHARAATPAEAALAGDVVVISIPFGRFRDLPTRELRGKIVVDASNYYPQRDGHLEELDEDHSTSSELLQAELRTHVVKAFNAMYWEHLRDYGRPVGDPARIGIPFSGDDARAKRVVAGLIDELGFDPVDAGALADGSRKHQPGGRAYAADLPTAELRTLLAD